MNEATDSHFFSVFAVRRRFAILNEHVRAADDNSRNRGNGMTFELRSSFDGDVEARSDYTNFTSQWSVFYSVIRFILSQPQSP